MYIIYTCAFISSVSSVQSLGHVWLFATPWTAASQASLCPSPTPGVYSTHVHWVGHAIEPSHPPTSPSLSSGSFRMSQLFQSGGQCISFSFSISPFNEYTGLFSFRIDWLDLFAVQRTLKSLLQPHSSKVSIVWCSAFFIVHPSHSYT